MATASQAVTAVSWCLRTHDTGSAGNWLILPVQFHDSQTIHSARIQQKDTAPRTGWTRRPSVRQATLSLGHALPQHACSLTRGTNSTPHSRVGCGWRAYGMATRKALGDYTAWLQLRWVPVVRVCLGYSACRRRRCKAVVGAGAGPGRWHQSELVALARL